MLRRGRLRALRLRRGGIGAGRTERAGRAGRTGGVGRDPSGPAAVWALGVTQVIGYGTLYYAFSILAPAMTDDLGWPTEWVFGAFSVALLAGGLVARAAGRLIDRFGAARIMTLGSIGAALALAGTGLAQGPVAFVLGLVAMQAMATLVLYDAAFATLVQTIPDPDAARRRMVHLTLIAGFASTLFWPGTTMLLTWLDWREIHFLFAALNLCCCCPLHFWLARSTPAAARTQARPTAADDAAELGTIPADRRHAAFLLVVTAFSLGGFVLSAVLAHFVPLLTALGLGGAGALVAMLFGPAQILSRIGNIAFGGNLAPVQLAMLSTALLPASIAVLLLGGSWLPAAFAFVLLFGLSSGLVTLVRGTVPLVLFGRRGYAAQLGRLAMTRQIVTSVAPFLFALGIEHLGARGALLVCAAMAAGGIAALAAVARLAARAPHPARRPA